MLLIGMLTEWYRVVFSISANSYITQLEKILINIISGAYWIIPKVHLAWNSDQKRVSKREYKNWFKHGEDVSVTYSPSLQLPRDCPSLQRFLKTVSKLPLNFLSTQEGPEVF